MDEAASKVRIENLTAPKDLKELENEAYKSSKRKRRCNNNARF